MIFCTISAEELLDKTNAKEEISEHVNNHPEGAYPDNVEKNGLSIIQKHVDMKKRELRTTLSSNRSKVDTNRIEKYKNDIVRFPAYANDLTIKEKRRLDEDLRDKKKKVATVRKDLENFKERNNLKHRSAIYPDDKRGLYAIVIFCLALEAIANSYFFASVNDYGLAGGFMMALIFSVMNATMAYMAIKLFRQTLLVNTSYERKSKKNKTHQQGSYERKKIFAILGLTITVAAVVVMILGVGHLRNALDTSMSGSYDSMREVSKVAIDKFQESPLGIETFDSWFLVALSFLLFILFAFDFYKMDDPYPGYGLQDRIVKKTENEYKYAKKAHTNILNVFVIDRKKEHEKKITSYNDEVIKVISAGDEIQRYTDDYSNFYKLQKDQYKLFRKEVFKCFVDDMKKFHDIRRKIDYEEKDFFIGEESPYSHCLDILTQVDKLKKAHAEFSNINLNIVRNDIKEIRELEY